LKRLFDAYTRVDAWLLRDRLAHAGIECWV